MASEFEFEGQEVALALKNTSSAKAMSTALVGCKFYVDNPDMMSVIETVNLVDGSLTLHYAAKRITLSIQRMALGYIVEEREISLLEPLITAAKPSHIKKAESARRHLAELGITHPSISSDDAVKLVDALKEAPPGQPPPFDTRLFIAQMLKRYELNRAYIRIARPWLDHAQSNAEVLVDVLIQLTSAYRAVHDIRSAMFCTDFAVGPGASYSIPPSQLAILFCQRAATLLDKFDRERDGSLLKEARSCANRSYAIQCSHLPRTSDEISAVYNRLEAAEKSQ